MDDIKTTITNYTPPNTTDNKGIYIAIGIFLFLSLVFIVLFFLCRNGILKEKDDDLPSTIGAPGNFKVQFHV